MPTHGLTLPVAATAPPTELPADEARALQGDAGAWDALFRTHNRRVVLLLIARGIRADLARDLAQAAWMRLFEQRRRLSRLSLPALAVTQAMFLARDRARRGDQRFTHVAFDDEVIATDMTQQLVDRDRLDRARAVLQSCSDSAQHVFRAIYAAPGSTTAEVAQQTGLSVQRVRQIVCEVRKKLRAAIQENRDA